MAPHGASAAVWWVKAYRGIDGRSGRFGGARAPHGISSGPSGLNWVDGRNVRIEVRWGAGDAARTRAYAAQLVGLKPDVILATNTPTARSLKQATETIPIVFTGLADPLTDGIVASLSNPRGNITGFTSFNAAIAGKWLQLLKEISPDTERVVVLYNPDTAPYGIFLPVMEVVAPQIELTLIRAPVADKASIESAIGKLSGAPGSALMVMPDVFTSVYCQMIFELAISGRLPTMCPLRIYTMSGGLMSYGSDFKSLNAAGGSLRRSHSAREKTPRSAGTGTNSIRVDHQPEDGQGARPQRAARIARPRG